MLFSYQRIEPIREDDVYGGYRAFLTAQFGKINAPLSIDITTGDVMTPAAELRAFPTMFEADSFSLWTYNNETILAEKVETILSRSVFSTRPRDFYDVYILSRSVSYDPELFRKALVATAAHRDSTEQIANPAPILVRISESDALKRLWDNYRRQFSYAADVEYADVIEAITNLLK